MQLLSKILWVTDPEQDEHPLLEQALSLADHHQAELGILLVPSHAEELSDLERITGREKLAEQLRQQAEQQLQAKLLGHKGRTPIHFHWSQQSLYKAVVELVGQQQYQLVLKQAKAENGLRSHIFGSQDQSLLRRCPCPVWLSKQPDNLAKRVLVAAIDADPAPHQRMLSLQVLELAYSLALSEGADLHIAYAWKAPGESMLKSGRLDLNAQELESYLQTKQQEHQQWLEETLQAFINSQDPKATEFLSPQLHLLKGAPAQVIPVLAKQLNAGLVLMGTVGRTGIPGLLIGNTAEAMINQLECSLLAIKPTDTAQVEH
ncbi:universal stress protein [Balneatrix alpica]|uniref:universal stress protein n=1 Tax=Balneatrix alpica TaxID=75684 RepID=UPI002738D13B|nr:universal stress protein [Balneatrix alpica]